MQDLQLDLTRLGGIVSPNDIETLMPRIDQCQQLLHHGGGAGGDFIGWVDLPRQVDETLMAEIEEVAESFACCDYVVCIGIGGSYLGARAVIDAIADSFESHRTVHMHPQVIYAGHNISQDYLTELLSLLQHKRFGIINISKSGTTTEPAIAFRFLRRLLEEKEGREAARRFIVAITDKNRGALRILADREGYRTFAIPDDVGGRFSVLTPVGLLPMAIAGVDIRALMSGARRMMTITGLESSIQDNPAAVYAAARYLLYQAGKKIEIVGNYHPKMHYIAEWWKQLFGESEGKEYKGLFTAAVDFTTDLHSMGQWIQEGERTIFETIISIDRPKYELSIPTDTDDLDGLNYIGGRSVDEVNKMAELGTALAHADGGVPNLRIILPELTAYSIGQLIYFFEKAVGLSAYLLEINPFDQPGVETYKSNMFALLGKPGHEEASQIIQERIQ